MQVVYGKPNYDIRGELGIDYYCQSEKANGSSIYKPISLIILRKGNIIVDQLMTVDKNYYNASLVLSEVYSDISSHFIGFYDNDGNLLAHTRLKNYADERVGGFKLGLMDICIRANFFTA